MSWPHLPLPEPADRWREALLALTAAVTLLALTIVLLTSALWPWEWSLLPLCALVALVIPYAVPRDQPAPPPAPQWVDIELPALPPVPPDPSPAADLADLAELADRCRATLMALRDDLAHLATPPAPAAPAPATSQIDPLTGAATHTAFMSRLGLDVEFARRHGGALALAVFDIADFTAINLRFGYQAGDDVLAAVADRIRARLSEADLFGRLGGDRFGVVWAGVTHTQAQALLSRVRESVAGRPLDLAPTSAARSPLAEPVYAQLRIGLALCPDDGLAAHDLVALAEDALDADHAPRQRSPEAARESLAPTYVPLNEPLSSPNEPEPETPTALIPRPASLAPLSSIDELSRRHSGIQALTTAMETRHPLQVIQARNLAELAEETALLLGRSIEEARLVGMAALLHDVGDLGISLDILNKPEALNDEERAFVQEHPRLGERLLTSVGGVLAAVAPMVAAHRERWDGTGYPRQLAGEAIPLGGRIVAVCDVFGAMTADRPYRAAISAEAATAELRAHAGTQFDPRVVEAFIAALSA